MCSGPKQLNDLLFCQCTSKSVCINSKLDSSDRLYTSISPLSLFDFSSGKSNVLRRSAETAVLSKIWMAKARSHNGDVLYGRNERAECKTNVDREITVLSKLARWALFIRNFQSALKTAPLRHL